MIDIKDLDYLGRIKEVCNQGQWDVKKLYGWMPPTMHTVKFFAQEGLSSAVCWQTAQDFKTYPSIQYFKIILKGKESPRPFTYMLETDECFNLFHLLVDIQSNGIETVDTQARKQHFSDYIRKDSMHLLCGAMSSPENAKAVLEKFRIFKQQEDEFAENCTAEFNNQVNPVVLFSANGRERKRNGTVINHYFSVSHTPMHKPGKPKTKSFCIQIQESTKGKEHKIKTSHLDLTGNQFSEFVEAMWEAYQQWWHHC